MRRIFFAIVIALFGTAALAVQFTGIQSGATTWTYTLTWDGLDNYSICQPNTTITITGLTGVTAASGPTSADAPNPGIAAAQLQWTAQVLNGGTTVVWTHAGGGTGNVGSAIRVFGFSITSTAQPGTASFATSGAARDTGCSPPTSLDISGTVAGPTPFQPSVRTFPVVGSTQGGQGSFFKTSVQLYNPRNSTIGGRIVFHTQGVSGSASDPSLAYSIEPGKTVSYADLLPAMGVASGLGSADLQSNSLPLPVSAVRVFNDAGAAGTTGLTEDPMSASEALQLWSTGAIIAPSDMQKFRLNIGVRTLDQGATIDITVRDKSGTIVKTTTKAYAATFFTQVSSVLMLDNYALTGGETISFTITGGSAFIYGATTDNVTNDPSVQFARKVQ